jgi:Tfp pilus assembly protein PilN
MRAVNLLPRDDAPKSFEAKRGVFFGAAGGAALITVGLTALMLGAGGAISERRAAVDAAKVELASLPTAPDTAEEVANNEALAAELSKRSTALSTALAGRVAWDSVLRQVSQVLPEDVWLTSVVSKTGGDEEAAAAPGAEEAVGVTITGSTYSQSGVARLLSRLAVAPALTNVRLQSSATAESGSSTLVDFTIIADVRTAGDAS